MRNLLLSIWIIIIMILSFPFLILSKIIKSQKFTFKIIEILTKSCNIVAGNKINSIGSKNLENLEQPFLLIANHEGIFDLFNIYSTINIPIGFVAKKELKNIPIFSSWMNQLHAVFLDRNSPKQGLKDMLLCINNLKQGYNMGIMPEGTRSTIDQEFKPGSLKIAQKAKVTIIPVTLRSTSKIFENRKTFKKQDTYIIYHKPILYEDYKHMTSIELTQKVQKIIYNYKEIK